MRKVIVCLSIVMAAAIAGTAGAQEPGRQDLTGRQECPEKLGLLEEQGLPGWTDRPELNPRQAEAVAAEAASVEATSAEVASLKAAPVEATPVEAALVETTPAEAAPVETTPAEAASVETTPAEAASVEADASGRAELTLSADVVSQFVWRGMALAHASVQPTLAVSWRGLSVGAWGSVSFVDSSDPREIDLMASYTTGGLSVGVIDYWTNEPTDHYFRYRAHQTGHVFEAFVAYDFGPLSASWQTNFAGADGLNRSGHRAYSSYIELAAPFSWLTCDWQAAVGAVPWATDYYEAPRFTVTNVSLRVAKNIRITDRFSLPLFVQLTANPECRRAYFVAGFSLNAFQ